MRWLRAFVGAAAVVIWSAGAAAQSNSLYKKGKTAGPGENTIHTTSLVRVTTSSDRVFKKHDLITIIVREQTKSKTVADAETDKSTSLKATLNAWPQFGKFWSQALRALAQRRDSSGIRVTSESEGGRWRLHLRAEDDSGAAVSDADWDAQVFDSQGQAEDVEIEPVGLGRYRAEVALAPNGFLAMYREH